MTPADLRELLLVLEEFGVREYAQGDLRLVLSPTLRRLDDVPVDPVSAPERRPESTSMWDDPSLWATQGGKRLDFHGRLK